MTYVIMILLNLTNGNSKCVLRKKKLNAESDVVFEVALLLDPLAIFLFWHGQCWLITIHTSLVFIVDHFLIWNFPCFFLQMVEIQNFKIGTTEFFFQNLYHFSLPNYNGRSHNLHTWKKSNKWFWNICDSLKRCINILASMISWGYNL